MPISSVRRITALEASLVIMTLKLLILRIPLLTWLWSAYSIHSSGLSNRVRRGGGILIRTIPSYKSAWVWGRRVNRLIASSAGLLLELQASIDIVSFLDIV